MSNSIYTDFRLYKKDMNTAKLEIQELEKLLNQAKSHRKNGPRLNLSVVLHPNPCPL